MSEHASTSILSALPRERKRPLPNRRKNDHKSGIFNQKFFRNAMQCSDSFFQNLFRFGLQDIWRNNLHSRLYNPARACRKTIASIVSRSKFERILFRFEYPRETTEDILLANIIYPSLILRFDSMFISLCELLKALDVLEQRIQNEI